jgi:adenine deaminase
MVDAGEILELLKFPVGGIFFASSVAGSRAESRPNSDATKKMGSSFDKAHFRFELLPFLTFPALHIISRGLVLVKDRKIVALVAA